LLNNKPTTNAPDKNIAIQNAVINVVLNSMSMIAFYCRWFKESGADIKDYQRRKNPIGWISAELLMTPGTNIHFAFSPSKTAKRGIRFKPKVSLGVLLQD